MESASKNNYVGYKGEALSNDYLAVERFLTSIGIEGESISSLEKLREMPSTQDVLFIPTERISFNKQRNATLRDWVERGGHLIVVSWTLTDAEGYAYGPEDPFLDSLGVEQFEHDSETLDDQEDRIPTDAVIGDSFLQIDFYDSYYLIDHSDTATVLAEDEFGVHALQYGIGTGKVTVLSDSYFLNNNRIKRYDHASFFWHLAQGEAQFGKVWLVYQEDMPSLWKWLAQHAPTVLISAAVLLLAWLWHSAVRFGPRLPDPVPVRRSVLEHLNTSGRFMWQHQVEDSLLKKVRAALHETMTYRHPGWSTLPKNLLQKKLAGRSGLDTVRIERALTASAEHRPLVFVELMRDLETLRKRL
jgi:hypothetical protein